MDKRDLVAAAARRTTLTQTQTREALDAILATMAAALAAGDYVIFRDFGRFSTWQQQQPVTGFDGNHYHVDAPRVAFGAAPALRRQLCEKPCADESA
jgi:nucleoid DNA-binding protein